MSEHEPADGSSTSAPGPGPAPVSKGVGDITDAVAWLRVNRIRYTDLALNHELRTAGYSEDEIGLIRAEVDRLDPPRQHTWPEYHDYRMTAGIIVIVSFFIVWAVISVPFLLQGSGASGMGGILSGILFSVLAVILGVTLVAINYSDGLQRATAGTVAAALAFPFVMLFIVAGICVATTRTATY